MKTTYTLEQLEKFFNSENWYDRWICAKQGYKLDILKEDENNWVCQAARKLQELNNN